MKEKLSSRKFWLTIASCATVLIAACAGEIDWAEAVKLVVAAVAAYQAANAVTKFANR